MNVKPTLLALAACACFANAQAATFILTGDTTGAPTFNRPLADLSDLSAVGTDVHYDSFAFTVTGAGSYTFRSFVSGALRGSPAFDNFLLLYQGSFDPSQGLVNAIAANDDLNGKIGRSGFSVTLGTGSTYVLVTTGFDNEDQGKYLDLIKGPGLVVAVPEPATYALMALGLGALGFARRYAASRSA